MECSWCPTVVFSALTSGPNAVAASYSIIGRDLLVFSLKCLIVGGSEYAKGLKTSEEINKRGEGEGEG